MIDLRSDTVTKPSAEMWRAMSSAPLGDDVLGEDPTVNRLEDAAAHLLGKEAALFVSSGTMGNLLGMLTVAAPGEEVIVDSASHIFISEVASAAAIGGIQLRPVETARGILSGAAIVRATRPATTRSTQPRTAAVAFENTHNRHGGTVWSISELKEASAAARQCGLRIHLDGARMFNAAIAIGASVKELAECADTVTFCLSKGLGCPAGSIFASTAPIIATARRWRSRLGGGMRQTGVLAAAGLYALDNLVDRLADDHANAMLLAQILGKVRGLEIDLSRVQSNIVFASVGGLSNDAFAQRCREDGLLVLPFDEHRVRFVTHLGISQQDVYRALSTASKVMQTARAQTL